MTAISHVFARRRVYVPHTDLVRPTPVPNPVKASVEVGVCCGLDYGQQSVTNAIG